jgi:hypothetical protein
MLDAYIIDRIRREREQPQNSGGIPLYRPPPPPPEYRPQEESREERRGVEEVDFRL